VSPLLYTVIRERERERERERNVAIMRQKSMCVNIIIYLIRFK